MWSKTNKQNRMNDDWVSKFFITLEAITGMIVCCRSTWCVIVSISIAWFCSTRALWKACCFLKDQHSICLHNPLIICCIKYSFNQHWMNQRIDRLHTVKRQPTPKSTNHNRTNRLSAVQLTEFKIQQATIWYRPFIACIVNKKSIQTTFVKLCTCNLDGANCCSKKEILWGRISYIHCFLSFFFILYDLHFIFFHFYFVWSYFIFTHFLFCMMFISFFHCLPLSNDTKQ